MVPLSLTTPVVQTAVSEPLQLKRSIPDMCPSLCTAQVSNTQQVSEESQAGTTSVAGGLSNAPLHTSDAVGVPSPFKVCPRVCSIEVVQQPSSPSQTQPCSMDHDYTQSANEDLGSTNGIENHFWIPANDGDGDGDGVIKKEAISDDDEVNDTASSWLDLVKEESVSENEPAWAKDFVVDRTGQQEDMPCMEVKTEKDQAAGIRWIEEDDKLTQEMSAHTKNSSPTSKGKRKYQKVGGNSMQKGTGSSRRKVYKRVEKKKSLREEISDKAESPGSVLLVLPGESSMESLHQSPTQGKYMDCFICPMRCRSSAELNNHVQVHIPPDPDKATLRRVLKVMRRKHAQCSTRNHSSLEWCTVCKRVFLDGKGHFNAAHHNKKVLCPDCGKLYRLSYFPTHQLVHLKVAKEDYLKCPDCPVTFKHKMYLERHRGYMHTGKPKAFICEICGKDFRKFYYLQRHGLTHSGAKPFPCPHCGRRFNQKTNLSIHMRQHTGLKPYGCELCEAAFTNKISLKMHKKKLHGIDWWKCQKE